MKARAVRLHGANDLRLDEFELPAIKEDEILVKVISDSICMSTYKCAVLGTAHKRVHPDVAEHPAIMGHEFAGEIVQVGEKHRDRFRPGMKFAQQPALNYKGTMWSPGYSYEFFGGDATYCIIPAEVMELGCLMEYRGRAFYEASLAEPMSCCIGAFHACYHTRMGCYEHEMGIMEGGRTAILAGAGPGSEPVLRPGPNGRYRPAPGQHRTERRSGGSPPGPHRRRWLRRRVRLRARVSRGGALQRRFGPGRVSELFCRANGPRLQRPDELLRCPL